LGRHDQYASSLDKFCTEYTDFLLTRRSPGTPIDPNGRDFEHEFTICKKAAEAARKDEQEAHTVKATVLDKIAEAGKGGKSDLTVMKVSSPLTPGQEEVETFLRGHGYYPRVFTDDKKQKWMAVSWGNDS